MVRRKVTARTNMVVCFGWVRRVVRCDAFVTRCVRAFPPATDSTPRFFRVPTPSPVDRPMNSSSSRHSAWRGDGRHRHDARDRRGVRLRVEARLHLARGRAPETAATQPKPRALSRVPSLGSLVRRPDARGGGPRAGGVDDPRGRRARGPTECPCGFKTAQGAGHRRPHRGGQDPAEPLGGAGAGRRGCERGFRAGVRRTGRRLLQAPGGGARGHQAPPAGHRGSAEGRRRG